MLSSTSTFTTRMKNSLLSQQLKRQGISAIGCPSVAARVYSTSQRLGQVKGSDRPVGNFSVTLPKKPNLQQISYNYPNLVTFDNAETDMFPRSLTKAILIKKPATSETDFRFHVPSINSTIHPEVKSSLKKNLGIDSLRVNQQEMYGRIVLTTQNAIAKAYSNERSNFALGLQKWAFQLWRMNKKVQLGTMYFLKKHQEHVARAIAQGESAQNVDTCWSGPIGTGKTLSYVLAALETAKCYKAWEQDYVQPGYRVLILVPSTQQAEKVGALLDAAVYPPFESGKSEEANKTLESYKALKRLQKQLDAKRRAVDIEEQDDFAHLQYEGLINLDAPDAHKVAPYRHINHLVLKNTNDIEKEIDAMDFHVPEIVISTPEQLLKHLPNSNYFNNLKLLIMDDIQGLSTFENEITEIKKHLKKGHNTVYVSDATVEEVPDVLKFDRPIENIQLSVLKKTQKLSLPHTVVSCTESGSLQSELIALVNKHRGKKVLITHQNNELLQLVSEVLASQNVHVCSATENDSVTDRDLATRYFNSRDNGVLIAHDSIALNSVHADSVDVLINFGDVQATQSTYVQLFDLLNSTAQGSFFLSIDAADQAKSISSLHKNIDFKFKKAGNVSSVDQEKINQVAEKALQTTSASLVNHFMTVLASPQTLQWNKNGQTPKFLQNPSGDDHENAKVAVAKTVALYNALGFESAHFPKSSVFQAQSVAAENAMRVAGLSKWAYHRKALQMLKVPTSFE